MESTIQLKESGIQQTIGIPSPSSTEKKSGIQNPRLFWIILNDATLKTGVLDEGGHVNYSRVWGLRLEAEIRIFSNTLRYTRSLTPTINSGRRKTSQKRTIKSQKLDIAAQKF